jgi:hypothetical protein
LALGSVANLLRTKELDETPAVPSLPKDIGMGALYLSSKLEECPLRMRDIINVYDLLLQKAAHSLGSKAGQPFQYHPMSYFGDTFYQFKEALVVAEMQILKRLGFNVHVTLPYNTLISYIKLIGLGDNSELCTKAWGYLNDGCDGLGAVKAVTDAFSDFRHLFTPCIKSQLSLAPRSSSLHGS